MYELSIFKFIIDVLGRKKLSCAVIISNKFILRFLKNIFSCIGLLAALSACSLDAKIESLSQVKDFEPLNRKDPDFIHGEVVTTSAGHQITGVFGEISETKKAFNNSQWEIQGVFYE